MPRPNHRDPETDPAAFLGDELGRARLTAGFSSQQALADHLGFDRSVIGKAETGERPPTPEVLASWAKACNIDPDLYGRMATLARRADGPVPRWFETWLDAEREAHTLRIWQPLIVPGLLQTADYARELFVAAGIVNEEADDLVAARLDRQSVLDRPGPVTVVTLLDESVLHRLIGSPKIMADQLEYLAERAALPHVVIQVVPSGNGASAGLFGAFDIALGDSTETLRMDAVEDVTTESRPLVRRAALVFDLVRSDALPSATTRTLILEMAEQWKTR